jgi:hypothetical protein
MKNAAIAATALALWGVLGQGAANAGQICGAQTHMRFGETRAYFQDILAACQPGGKCSLISQAADRTLPAGFAQQMRVEYERAALQTPRLSFVAVQPMADLSRPTALRLGRTQVDLSGKIGAVGNVANEYVITDPAEADGLTTRLLRGRGSAVWTYHGEGEATATRATFGLRGLARARAWAACMLAR